VEEGFTRTKGEGVGEKKRRFLSVLVGAQDIKATSKKGLWASRAAGLGDLDAVKRANKSFAVS